jgi:hypothetical protein
MSYDISLCDPVTHKPLKADSTHFIAGGMRAMGGTKELWLNVTYNYGHFYYRPEVFGEGGIRSIYGKTISRMVLLIASCNPSPSFVIRASSDFAYSTELLILFFLPSILEQDFFVGFPVFDFARNVRTGHSLFQPIHLPDVP